MAKKIRHWKHGWIPVSPEAKAYVAGKGPKPGEWKDVSAPWQKPGTVRIKDQAGFKPLRVTPKTAGNLMDEIQANGGFTWDPKTNGILKVGEAKGFAVAVPGTERIVGVEKVSGDDITREDFVKGVADVLQEHWQELADGAVLGGWYSPERNAYMVELSNIVDPSDRDAAIQLGKERNQEAIFDLATGETVFTGGTGDHVPDTVPADWSEGSVLAQPVRPLKTEERAAALYYTGPGFNPLNGALRRGDPLTPQVDFYRRHLDAAIAASEVRQPATVYRGLTSWPGFRGNPPGFNPGDTYIDRGYMSTAISDGPPSNYQGDVMMQIEIPPGARALDLTQMTHHPEERELLLPAGTPLRILSDTIQDGQRVIHAEYAVAA